MLALERAMEDKWSFFLSPEKIQSLNRIMIVARFFRVKYRQDTHVLRLS